MKKSLNRIFKQIMSDKVVIKSISLDGGTGYLPTRNGLVQSTISGEQTLIIEYVDTEKMEEFLNRLDGDDDLRGFLNKLEGKVNDYCDRSPKEIPTCDVRDFWEWIEEAKEEMGIDNE